MSAPKTGGPIVDVLSSPRNETESFLVELYIAYQDFDEALANHEWAQLSPGVQVCMPRRDIPYAMAGQ